MSPVFFGKSWPNFPCVKYNRTSVFVSILPIPSRVVRDYLMFVWFVLREVFFPGTGSVDWLADTRSPKAQIEAEEHR